jgi:hypothetical protein
LALHIDGENGIAFFVPDLIFKSRVWVCLKGTHLLLTGTGKKNANLLDVIYRRSEIVGTVCKGAVRSILHTVASATKLAFSMGYYHVISASNTQVVVCLRP